MDLQVRSAVRSTYERRGLTATIAQARSAFQDLGNHISIANENASTDFNSGGRRIGVRKSSLSVSDAALQRQRQPSIEVLEHRVKVAEISKRKADRTEHEIAFKFRIRRGAFSLKLIDVRYGDPSTTEAFRFARVWLHDRAMVEVWIPNHHEPRFAFSVVIVRGVPMLELRAVAAVVRRRTPDERVLFALVVGGPPAVL